jgi:23S rRNA (uracil1939-C5)-methyltransferase
VVDVIEASPNRISPPCGYFGACTGCQWQHVSYEHQLELKRHIVEDAIGRVGGLSDVAVLPTLPSSQQYNYRNHARFTIGPEGHLGFVHRQRRRFVEIRECMLMDPWINDTLGQLQGHCAETTQLSIRYGPRSGGWLVQPNMKSTDVPVETGQKHYRETLGGSSFRVAASSFFQVNIPQAEQILDLLRDSLRLTGKEVVVDAYAGVGTFAALLAPHAGQMIAIEESASAVQDAEENLAGIPNVEMRKDKTEAALAVMEENVDALVLDPPRAGCQPQALDSMMSLAPARVAYVSCDPETLARDLAVLAAGPYRIESVQPIDMFPQTHHVECVTTLSLKTGHPVVLASSSPRRRYILQNAGIPFRTVEPDLDESHTTGGTPEEAVASLALAKALKVAPSVHRGTVLAADTQVFAQAADGPTALGKPRDEAQALDMLRTLRGRTHRVLTGVAVVDIATGRHTTGVQETAVTMRPYTDEEALAFIASGNASDKAGAYAIQDADFHPAAHVEGCYTNVVGLPLCLATTLLGDMGVELALPVAPIGCSQCQLREVGE